MKLSNNEILSNMGCSFINSKKNKPSLGRTFAEIGLSIGGAALVEFYRLRFKDHEILVDTLGAAGGALITNLAPSAGKYCWAIKSLGKGIFTDAVGPYSMIIDQDIWKLQPDCQTTTPIKRIRAMDIFDSKSLNITTNNTDSGLTKKIIGKARIHI
jgi:hypothetical protein